MKTLNSTINPGEEKLEQNSSRDQSKPDKTFITTTHSRIVNFKLKKKKILSFYQLLGTNFFFHFYHFPKKIIKKLFFLKVTIKF